MAKIITGLEKFDNKRTKVTLDYGEVTFLLYKNELTRLGLSVSDEISDEEYRKIKSGILIPRAKKRSLYYMKSSDRSEAEIRDKLKSGFYPEEVIEETLCYLKSKGCINDERYAENYIEWNKGTHSRRELEARLYKKGIRDSGLRDMLNDMISDEEEYLLCEKLLKKKYPSGVSAEDRNKAYGFLARKGFSYEAIEHAVAAVKDHD